MKQDGHDTYQEYTVTVFRICPAGFVERGHLILRPVGLSFRRRSLVTCRRFYCVDSRHGSSFQKVARCFVGCFRS